MREPLDGGDGELELPATALAGAAGDYIGKCVGLVRLWPRQEGVPQAPLKCWSLGRSLIGEGGPVRAGRHALPSPSRLMETAVPYAQPSPRIRISGDITQGVSKNNLNFI
ncbi:uncharacterized protein VTP21DRAFT_6504 [Calcarisporiella thermophila]|uniref:uncharacterized protein n=1 Tax=Calcarisporiella thermophila TaxID=911321 RepID=UPI003741EE3C